MDLSIVTIILREMREAERKGEIEEEGIIYNMKVCV